MADTSDNDDPDHTHDRGGPRRPDALTRRAVVAGSASLGLASLGVTSSGCAAKGDKWDPTPVRNEQGFVSLAISDYPPLATAGGMVAVHPEGVRKPILVMRLENDNFRVLSLRCPHLGCTVRWNNESQALGCPCHGSRFDDKGKVVEGPAKSSLPELRSSYRDLTLKFELPKAT